MRDLFNPLRSAIFRPTIVLRYARSILLGLVLVLSWTTDGRAQIDDAAKALQRNDFAAALPLLRNAASTGDAHAQVWLAQLLLNGKAGITDPEQAASWYKKAALQNPKGNEYVAIAQLNLAALYANGRGVPKDAAEAVRLYKQSAANGFVEAQTTLVGMYYRGQGVERNIVEALKWALVAAGNGDARGRSAFDLIRREATPAQTELAAGEAHKQFPNLKLPETESRGAALSPRLEIEKGVPRDPTPSPGWSAEFEAIHRQPMADNDTLIPKLKALSVTQATPYMFELARRVFIADKREGVTVFWLARHRALYDAGRCTDATAAQGIAQWNAVLADVISYIQKNPDASRAGRLAALEREVSLPANTSPAWICIQGINAIKSALQDKKLENWVKPESQWPAIRKSARETMEKAARE